MVGVDWSTMLPSDLWCLIGKKLESAADRVRFRAVSKSWRSILPYRQPPWLMLAESHSEHERVLVKPLTPPPPRGFVIVGEQHMYQFHLPQSAHQAKCLGSTGNWLILIDLEKMIRLLNPFSGVQIDLPPVDHGLLEDEDEEEDDDEDELPVMPPDYYRDIEVRKVTLSPSSSSCIAMAIFSYKGKLAIARPGDVSWTTVETPVDPDAQDVIFYKEQFYVISYNGTLFVCDLDGQLAPKASLLIDGFLGEKRMHYHKQYLVEWLGELLFVIKYLEPVSADRHYKTNRFEVYKLDFASKKWTVLKNLGEYSLFLGMNTSTALLVSGYYRSMKKNCIYFTDDFDLGYLGAQIAGGDDMGVFHLDDGSIQPHYNGISKSLYSPPNWIVPTETIL